MSQSSTYGADRVREISWPESAAAKMRRSVALSARRAHLSGTDTKWPPKNEAESVEANPSIVIRLDRAASAQRALRVETTCVFGIRNNFGSLDRIFACEDAQPYLSDAGKLKNCMDSYRPGRGKRDALATAEQALDGPCNIAYLAIWRQGAKAAIASRSEERLGRCREVYANERPRKIVRCGRARHCLLGDRVG